MDRTQDSGENFEGPNEDAVKEQEIDPSPEVEYDGPDPWAPLKPKTKELTPPPLGDHNHDGKALVDTTAEPNSPADSHSDARDNHPIVPLPVDPPSA